MASQVIPVTSFIAYIAQKPYCDCDVISVTHSKDLKSVVLHEYLHLIIRHKPSNAWCRLLVERQTNQDQVIVGYWPWVPVPAGPVASRSSGKQLPLPLLMCNLRLKSLSLQFVANILLAVHRLQPKYHVLFANCFWYAGAVFEILRGTSGSQYRDWPSISLKALPIIPHSLLVLRNS